MNKPKPSQPIQLSIPYPAYFYQKGDLILYSHSEIKGVVDQIDLGHEAPNKRIYIKLIDQVYGVNGQLMDELFCDISQVRPLSLDSALPDMRSRIYCLPSEKEKIELAIQLGEIITLPAFPIGSKVFVAPDLTNYNHRHIKGEEREAKVIDIQITEKGFVYTVQTKHFKVSGLTYKELVILP